jgi:hypothetical protein
MAGLDFMDAGGEGECLDVRDQATPKMTALCL